MTSTLMQIWTYKGRRYHIIMDVIKIKNSETREWEWGILYSDNKTGAFFVRKKTEFLERFTRLKEQNK